MPWTDLPPPLPIVLGVYVVMSMVSFLAFGVDKFFAGRGTGRTPESTLHLLSLLGGWPGALIAMPLFRHKRRKGPFVVVVWSIAAAHAVAWAWWIDRPG